MEEFVIATGFPWYRIGAVVLESFDVCMFWISASNSLNSLSLVDWFIVVMVPIFEANFL